MGARVAGLAYGVAVGADIVGATIFLSLALARRPRYGTMLGFGSAALLVAAATIALCMIDPVAPRPSTPNWPFAVASLTVFVVPVVVTIVCCRAVVKLIAGEIAGLVAQVDRLTRLRQTAVADERHRISRELHDSVSQPLYSLAMLGDALSGAVEHDPAAAGEQARQIRSTALDALGEIRVMLLELRRSNLEAMSLGGLLRALAGHPPGQVPVRLDVTGEADLPADVKLAAYRIAQEALSNAHKHAAASRVAVRLDQRRRALTLSIVDDGAGFPTGAADAGHHGLRIMRERADAVGGRLEVDSGPGRGTRVEFSWAHPDEAGSGGSGVP